MHGAGRNAGRPRAANGRARRARWPARLMWMPDAVAPVPGACRRAQLASRVQARRGRPGTRVRDRSGSMTSIVDRPRRGRQTLLAIRRSLRSARQQPALARAASKLAFRSWVARAAADCGRGATMRSAHAERASETLLDHAGFVAKTWQGHLRVTWPRTMPADAAGSHGSVTVRGELAGRPDAERAIPAGRGRDERFATGGRRDRDREASYTADSVIDRECAMPSTSSMA